MKKLLIVLTLFFLVLCTSTPAFAAPPNVNNVTTSNLAFNQFGKIEANMLKTGPALGATLSGISSTLFNYLAIIALVLFAVKELMFGDKGIKEFMLFAFFIIIVKGFLEGYNLFFNDGVVYMFYALGQKVAGVTDPLTLFQNIFYSFYNILSSQFQSLHGSVWAIAGFLADFILYFIGLIVLIVAFLLVAGTILIVQAYIILALVSGYIFVPFMIFKPLEFLWNGWLKFLLSSAISYFLIFVVLKIFSLFMNNVLITYIHTLNANTPYTISSLINEITYTFILLIFGWLVTKIPAIAGEIVSGMPNMSVAGVIAAGVGAASVMLAGGRLAGTAAKTGAQVVSKAKGGKGE